MWQCWGVGGLVVFLHILGEAGVSVGISGLSRLSLEMLVAKAVAVCCQGSVLQLSPLPNLTQQAISFLLLEKK